jgi:hypothetical protein
MSTHGAAVIEEAEIALSNDISANPSHKEDALSSLVCPRRLFPEAADSATEKSQSKNDTSSTER